jgi:hypothetical protein
MIDEILVVLGAISGAIIGSIIGPIISNWYQVRQEQRRVERQEVHVIYSDIIDNIAAFYSGSENSEGVKKFSNAYRRAWLYVPDEVIESVNKFIVSIGGTQKEESELDKNLRNLMWNMRKDYKKETKLKQEQFLIIVVLQKAT